MPASNGNAVAFIAVGRANNRCGIVPIDELVTFGKSDTWNATRYVDMSGVVSNCVVTDPSGLFSLVYRSIKVSFNFSETFFRLL